MRRTYESDLIPYPKRANRITSFVGMFEQSNPCVIGGDTVLMLIQFLPKKHITNLQ